MGSAYMSASARMSECLSWCGLPQDNSVTTATCNASQCTELNTHCRSIWLLADGFSDQVLSLLCEVRQTPQYHALMPTVPTAGEGRASHVQYCMRHSQSSFCR